MGEPTLAGPLRSVFFGPDGGPAPAPVGPTPSADLLDEFRDRVAPHMLNAWHPRTLSYFTPPPLVMSIVGELLAQFTQQGVDVWHAGPSAAFVEEEVVRWLCDLVGYGEGSFGLLTSGGVMANFMALALARDVRLRRLRGLDRPPRGAALEDARVYVSDQGHFSVARALDELGFPPQTLVTLPSDDRFRLRVDALADAVSGDLAAGLTPFASWPCPARPTPAPSTTCRRSRRSRSGTACGSTSMPRTAARHDCQRSWRRSCPAWSSPTRSRSTRTSGSSRRTTSGA